MTSWHGGLFQRLDYFWSNIQSFFYNHKTLFDILFMGVYFTEQLTLFLLILLIPKYAYVFAGVFALLIITTISFEKICMESRYTVLNRDILFSETRRERSKKEYDLLAKDNEILRKALNAKVNKKK